MKLIATTTTAALTLAAALALAGAASAAPSGPSRVDQTVNQLKSQGYTVIVSKPGSSTDAQCTISAIRPGQTYSRSDSGSGLPGSSTDIVTTVTSKTIYLDLKC